MKRISLYEKTNTYVYFKEESIFDYKRELVTSSLNQTTKQRILFSSIFPTNFFSVWADELKTNFLLVLIMKDGGVDKAVVDCRQHQLGRMADFPPLLTFLVFDL